MATDASGQAPFTAVFPDCCAGRFPHLFSSMAVATGGRFAALASQLAMPTAAFGLARQGGRGGLPAAPDPCSADV